MALSVKKLASKHPHLIFFKLDLVNAYNTQSREDALESLGEAAPELASFLRQFYGAADESIENLLATLENVSSSLNEMKYDFNNQCKDSVKIVNRIRNEPKDYLYVVKKNESKDLEAPVWPVNDVAELIAKVRNKHAEIKETRRLRNRAVQESKEMNEDLSNSRDDFQSKCEVHQSKVQHAKLRSD